jgi:hypothetical protein
MNVHNCRAPLHSLKVAQFKGAQFEGNDNTVEGMACPYNLNPKAHFYVGH